MSEGLQVVIVAVLVVLVCTMLIWFAGGDTVEESGVYCFGGERVSFESWMCKQNRAFVYEMSIESNVVVDRYETPFSCLGFRDAILRSCNDK
jgi:hypothetical protein